VLWLLLNSQKPILISKGVYPYFEAAIMLFLVKKFFVGLLVLLVTSNAYAGYEGTWRFTPDFYTVTANGFTQTWTLDQYLNEYGQFTELTRDDFIFEQQYSDSWLTPQTFNYNESGISGSTTVSYTFSSDSSGKQITKFSSTYSDPTSGQSSYSTGHLEYFMEKISGGSSSNGNSGNNISTSPTVADTVSELNVTEVQGSVFEITPTATSAVDNNVSDNSTIFTASNASIEVNLGNNNKVTVAEKTVVTLSPEVTIDSGEKTKKASLVRGAVDYNIAAGGATAFEVATPIVAVKVGATTQRANQQTNFTAQYSQSGNIGTSTISVTSGSVEVTNRNGVTTTLSAGQEKTFSNQVLRTTWVQPADSAFLFGGETNTLAWASYPGAIGYIIEYTFPSPSFSEENPISMEFPEKKVLIPAVNFQIIEDIAVMEMALPASLNGLVVEARLFPVDGQGNILNSSTASDKGTFGFKAK